MVSEILEYPFDLAKVRLQAQLIASGPTNNALRFDGPLDCLMQTWRDEGVRGLYRVCFFAFSMIQVVTPD